MNKLDLSLAVGGNIFFSTQGTFNFLQDAFQQGIAAAIIEEIGDGYDPTAGYIMYGCVATVGGSTSITAGAIFYNGEVFLVPAQTTANPTGGDVLVVNIDTTQYTVNADPATFSDGPHDVHNIRQAGIEAGVSGSGTMGGLDFSDLILMRFVKDTNIQRFTAPIVRALIGPTYDSSKFYIMYGCNQSGFSVSAGVIFHDDRIYTTGGISTGFGCSGSLVLIFTYGDDYTLNLACGTSGTGAVDFSDLVQMFALTWVNVAPFLNAGWVAGPGTAPQVTRDFSGHTILRGSIQATGASSTTIMTLPATYRPQVNINPVSYSVLASGSSFVVTPLAFATSGTVVVNNITPASGDEVSLDGIMFPFL